MARRWRERSRGASGTATPSGRALPLFIERTEAVVLLRAGGRGLPAARVGRRALGRPRRTAVPRVGTFPALQCGLAVDGAWSCVQAPGDYVLDPARAWHCTLNFEESVAFTRNVVNGRDAKAVRASGWRSRGTTRHCGKAADARLGGRGGPTRLRGTGTSVGGSR